MPSRRYLLLLFMALAVGRPIQLQLMLHVPHARCEVVGCTNHSMGPSHDPQFMHRPCQ